MTMELMIDALRTLSIAVLALGGIGVVSLRLGYIQKSIPTALISAILLSAVYGNAAISANGTWLSLLISGAGLIITVIVMAELTNKVNKMEVE